MEIKVFMTQDHRRCDEAFATAEALVGKEAWDMATEAFEAFTEMTLAHFTMEEEVLFPAFEEKTGMTYGPTEVMRQEHGRMREVIAGLREALDNRDQRRFYGISETLMILLQQHNMKEEQILYTMADRNLESGSVIQAMQQRQAG